MKNPRIVASVALLLLSIASVARAQPVAANPPVVLNPSAPSAAPAAPRTPSSYRARASIEAPGAVELSLQLTASTAFVNMEEQQPTMVPYLETGVWIGTGLGADRVFGYAIGYLGRVARAPAETAHRHSLSLAFVRHNMTVFVDGGVGLFHGDDGEGALSTFWGTTLHRKIGGSGLTLVFPFHGELIVSPVVSACVTLGVGLGFSTL